MNKKEFVSKIKSLKNDIIINDSFFDSNKKKFLNYVSSEFDNDSVNSKVFDLNAFINKFKVPGFVFGASAALFVCGSLTVSASLSALPGDPLYSVKLSFENTRSAIAFNDRDYVDLQVEFAGNRIDELSQVLISSRIANKQKIAYDLVNRIDENLANIPSKVVALNKNREYLEGAAKNFDDKVNEYSGKLNNIKKVASNAGMKDLTENIDSTNIKSNHISVKTLNIVVQNMDLSKTNEALKKDIIDRVEKKVDNIKDVVDNNSKDVVNNDSNDIINKSLSSDNESNTNKNTNTNQESGGKSSLSEQLNDIKLELNKVKVGLASTDMASFMTSIDKSLDNTNVSAVIDYTNKNLNQPIDLQNTDTKGSDQNNNVIIDAPVNNVPTSTKKDDIKMQIESGYGYGIIHEDDYKLESLWSNEE